MKKAIFYGTTTMTTEDVANKLKDILEDFDLYDVKDGLEPILNYDFAFILTPTYGRGELEEHWSSSLEKFGRKNLSNLSYALIGIGDIIVHSDSFVNTLSKMKKIFSEMNAKIYGNKIIKEDYYDFIESFSVEDGYFIGLPLDELNYYNETDEKLEYFISELRKEIDI